MGLQLILSREGNSLDRLLNSSFRISATPYQFDALSGSRLVAISFEISIEPFTERQLFDFVPQNPPVSSPQQTRRREALALPTHYSGAVLSRSSTRMGKRAEAQAILGRLMIRFPTRASP
jgi:hypothetical protein